MLLRWMRMGFRVASMHVLGHWAGFNIYCVRSIIGWRWSLPRQLDACVLISLRHRNRSSFCLYTQHSMRLHRLFLAAVSCILPLIAGAAEGSETFKYEVRPPPSPPLPLLQTYGPTSPTSPASAPSSSTPSTRTKMCFSVNSSQTPTTRSRNSGSPRSPTGT